MDYFDIGVLGFSYDSAGIFMQNITIVERDQNRNYQTRVVNRDYLISINPRNIRVYLVEKWRGLRLTADTMCDQYAPIRRIELLTVDGQPYLKASLDRSAIDDMG